MRRIIDYANFGANHVGGVGDGVLPFVVSICYLPLARVPVLSLCVFLSRSPLARSHSFSLSYSFSFSLSPSALSLILAPFLALILFLSFTFSLSLSLSLKKDRLINELKAVFAALSTLPTGSERKTLRVSKGEEGS